jgi:hypothetical protein
MARVWEEVKVKTILKYCFYLHVSTHILYNKHMAKKLKIPKSKIKMYTGNTFTKSAKTVDKLSKSDKKNDLRKKKK